MTTRRLHRVNALDRTVVDNLRENPSRRKKRKKRKMRRKRKTRYLRHEEEVGIDCRDRHVLVAAEAVAPPEEVDDLDVLRHDFK